jgi:hypothetical protein
VLSKATRFGVNRHIRIVGGNFIRPNAIFCFANNYASLHAPGPKVPRLIGAKAFRLWISNWLLPVKATQ